MTQYENDIEKVTHLRAQATKALFELQETLDRMAQAQRHTPKDDGIRYTDVRGPVAGGIHVERFLHGKFDVSDLRPMQYHLSGLKLNDLYDEYSSFMKMEGRERQTMSMPDLRAYICRTYDMVGKEIVHRKGDLTKSWVELRIRE